MAKESNHVKLEQIVSKRYQKSNSNRSSRQPSPLVSAGNKGALFAVRKPSAGSEVEKITITETQPQDSHRDRLKNKVITSALDESGPNLNGGRLLHGLNLSTSKGGTPKVLPGSTKKKFFEERSPSEEHAHLQETRRGLVKKPNESTGKIAVRHDRRAQGHPKEITKNIKKSRVNQSAMVRQGSPPFCPKQSSRKVSPPAVVRHSPRGTPRIQASPREPSDQIDNICQVLELLTSEEKAKRGIPSTKEEIHSLLRKLFKSQLKKDNKSESRSGGLPYSRERKNSLANAIHIEARVNLAAEKKQAMKNNVQTPEGKVDKIRIAEKKPQRFQTPETERRGHAKNPGSGAGQEPAGGIIPTRSNSREGENSNSGNDSSHIKTGSNIVLPCARGVSGDHDEEAKIQVKVFDSISNERDKLIMYSRLYIEKYREIPQSTIEYYKFVKLIGKGAFGKVTLGIDKMTGKQVAIKSIDKNYIKDEFSKKKVFQEVYILKKIRHANVIRLLEVFEGPKHLFIVMEYASGGDLLKYVKRKGRLTEPEARKILRQIIFGLGHIHSRSVLHRDIKLDNILLDSDECVKICDFGVSKIVKAGETVAEQCGTPAYIAPEVISNEGYEGYYIDHWSLGIVLYAMLCATIPFKAQNMLDLLRVIKTTNVTFPVPLSENAKNLVRGLLRMEPKERLSLPEILAHPWMREDQDEDINDSDSFMSKKECTNPDCNPFLPNINLVNVANLFFGIRPGEGLTYGDYNYIYNDLYTQHLDEDALRVLESYGYPRKMVVSGLSSGELNHATAAYHLGLNIEAMEDLNPKIQDVPGFLGKDEKLPEKNEEKSLEQIKELYRKLLYSKMPLFDKKESFDGKCNPLSSLLREAKTGALGKEINDSLYCPLLLQKKQDTTIKPLCYGDVIVLQVADKSYTKFELILENYLEKDLVLKKKIKDGYVDCRKLFRILPVISGKSQDALRKEIESYSGDLEDISNRKLGEKAEQALNEYQKSQEAYQKLIGKPIQFENKVQLVHEATKQYLSIKGPFSEFISEGLVDTYKPVLNLYGSDDTYFQFLPHYPSQMERKKIILTNYSVRLVTEYQKNQVDIRSPFLYSSFIDSENKFSETSSTKSLCFLRKETDMLFKFKVIQHYSENKGENLIKKPIRIQSTTNYSFLRTHSKSKSKVEFNKCWGSWASIWQITEEKGETGSIKNKKVSFKNLLTSKYLKFQELEEFDDHIPRFFLSDTPQYFIMHSVYVKSLYKILDCEKKLCVNLQQPEQNFRKQEAAVSSKKENNFSNIFKVVNIEEGEFEEILFCHELMLIFEVIKEQFKTLEIKADIEKLNKWGRIYIQALIFLNQYLLNLLNNYLTDKYPIDSPVPYRQDAIFQYGILKIIIKIFKNNYFKIKYCYHIPASYAILSLFKSAILNCEKAKLLVIKNLQHFLVPIYSFSEMQIFISLFENAQIYDPNNPTQLSKIGKIFLESIDQFKKKIKKKGVTPSNIEFLLKIIENSSFDDYNSIFSDTDILRSATNNSLGSSDMGTFVLSKDEGGKCVVNFLQNSHKSEKWELALEEIRFFSFLIQKDRQLKIASIQKLYDKEEITKKKEKTEKEPEEEQKEKDYFFPNLDQKDYKGKTRDEPPPSENDTDETNESNNKYLNLLIEAVKNKENDSKIRAGLLHFLCLWYIDRPKNQKNIFHKYFNIKKINDKDIFVKFSSLSPKHISIIWEILISILTISDIPDNTNLDLIAEALRCVKTLIKLNLVWNLKSGAKKEFLFSLFSLMRILFSKRIMFHESANLRLNTLKIENSQEEVHVALKNSFSLLIYKYNDLLKKTNSDDNQNLKQFCVLEELICENFLLFQRQREYTLLCNAAQYFLEKVETFKTKNRQELLYELQREKHTILPGKNLVQRHRFLIDDLVNYYNEYISVQGKAFKFGDDNFNFVDHLILLFNRTNKTNSNKLYAHSCLMNLFKQRIMFIRNIEFVDLIQEEQEEIYNQVKNKSIKLISLLHKEYILNSNEVETTLKKLENALIEFRNDFDSDEVDCNDTRSIFQTAFRYFKMHIEILNFLKNNIQLFVISKNNFISMHSYNYIFDLCCNILISFCKKHKKHKNDLWPYLHFFLTSDIPIRERNYDLELIYEICKDNEKRALTYTLNESIEKFKKKANILFTDKTLKTSKSAKTTANIFLQILEYDKLFPQAVWFFRLFKTIYGNLRFRPAQDIEDVEIFFGFICYLDTKLDAQVQEIGEEDPHKIFEPNKMFELLIQFSKDIITYSDKSHCESYLKTILQVLLSIYLKLYFPEEFSLQKQIISETKLMYLMFAKMNPKIIQEFYEQYNYFSVLISEKKQLKSLFLKLKELQNSNEKMENDYLFLWSEFLEEQDEKPPDSVSDTVDSTNSTFFANEVIFKTYFGLNLLDEKTIQTWDLFKMKYIIKDKENNILEEIENNAYHIKGFLEEYFIDSKNLKCVGYIEFLKNSIKMFSSVTILEQNIVQQYNLRVFLLTLITLLKIYERNVLQKKLSSKFHARVSSLFMSLGLMKMCYKLLTQLPESALPITEPLLFSLMKHLMYGDGEEGQDKLLKIFKTHKVTERIFKRIFQVMDFKIISITEYNIYKINSSSSFVSRASYKLKLDLIKNIYSFLKIAADKQYKGFQDYFLSQNNIDQNYNIIKMSVLFLNKLINKYKTSSTDDKSIKNIKQKCLYLAQFPLRAILEFIQGPNENNLQEIINNGFLTIAERILSDISIENQLEKDPKNRAMIKKNNYAIMKLKYHVIKILKDILNYSSNKEMIYSIFQKLLSKKIVMSNLYDFGYLFIYENDLKYETKLFFNYIKTDLLGSSFIIEVGFELVFLLKIFHGESTESDIVHKEIQTILNGHKKKYQGFFSTIQQYIFKLFQLKLFCKNKFNTMVINEFDYRKKDEVFQKELVQNMMGKVLMKYTANVEVLIKKKPKILYFSRMPYINYLEDSEKKEFETQISFPSRISRNEGLLRNAPSLLNSGKTLYEVDKFMQGILLLNLISRSYKVSKVFAMLIALTINLLLIISDTINSEVTTEKSWLSSTYNTSIFILGIFLFFFMTLILTRFSLNKLPYYWTKAKDQNWESFNIIYQNEMRTMEIFIIWLKLVFTDFYFVFYFSVFISCILGLFFDIFFFSYTLSILVIPLNIVRNLLRAIIEPMRQIFLTLIIYMIVVYFFTIIASISYKEYFPNDECSELMKCYLVTLDRTFKSDGGVAGYMNLTYANGPTLMFSRILFDFLYAFVIGELFIQMISGIVIDKFGSMREESEKLQEQYDKECFVCGKNRGVLEIKTAKGFKHHIDQEHNFWDYVFFVGYLKEKPEYELDSDESYILNKIKKNKITWFPNDRVDSLYQTKAPSIQKQ